VSAVAATAEQFLTDGRITEDQKDAIILAAARSSCGSSDAPIRGGDAVHPGKARSQSNRSADLSPPTAGAE
jgi:hypothetical protein